MDIPRPPKNVILDNGRFAAGNEFRLHLERLAVSVAALNVIHRHEAFEDSDAEILEIVSPILGDIRLANGQSHPIRTLRPRREGSFAAQGTLPWGKSHRLHPVRYHGDTNDPVESALIELGCKVFFAREVGVRGAIEDLITHRACLIVHPPLLGSGQYSRNTLHYVLVQIYIYISE